jgi:bifunctional DNA-binding transcriptional regulator/antitoxin component of YhaV-PrlF toxin-antitoxin module
MLAKLTSKNQLTLPKQVVEALGHPSHFTVEVEDGRLVLSPAHPAGAAAVRRKLAELEISETDIAEAVNWARAQARTKLQT